MARPLGGRRRTEATALPGWIKPQLTKLVDQPPDGPEWLHEIKFDGYRMHARLDWGAARLLTRTGIERPAASNRPRGRQPRVAASSRARAAPPRPDTRGRPAPNSGAENRPLPARLRPSCAARRQPNPARWAAVANSQAALLPVDSMR